MTAGLINYVRIRELIKKTFFIDKAHFSKYDNNETQFNDILCRDVLTLGNLPSFLSFQ